MNGKRVAEIGDKTFSDCLYLTSVTLPEGVVRIGAGAFSGCSRLTSVTLPEGVTEIGMGAFFACDCLESVIIPLRVEIKEGAFTGCTAIEEMIFRGPPPQVKPLNEKAKEALEEKKGISDPETLPDTRGYYLPEYAKDWEAILGGETGEWNNLRMKPLPKRMFKLLH
ncbi:MAG: leucine-rich repeat domain-containing protein [bacterium]|nr:leucine-rich repeat domain-containing protein [bacterium]